MKSLSVLVVRLLLTICLAAAASMWAIGMVDGLYRYRSPLRDHAPEAGESIGPRQTRRLVIVLVDALRYDTAWNGDVMPVLARLREIGASAKMISRPPSYSQMGYTTLFTGAWPEINDSAAFNLEYNEIHPWTQDNLFSSASRKGLRTAVAGYYWLEKLIPKPAITAGAFFANLDPLSDRETVDAAVPWLAESEQFPLILIHLTQVDHAGHTLGGPRSPSWNAAASQVDALLGEILAKVDLSQDTILLVSDHGQIDAGGHGGPELITRTEPFVLAGKGILPGEYDDIRMVDVAPTGAALLGLNLPASTQGRVLTEMLDLPLEVLENLAKQEPAQQEGLYRAYLAGVENDSGGKIGLALPAPIPDSFLTGLPGMEAVRSARLQRERLDRALVSLPLALAVIIGFIRWRLAHKKWYVSGALLCLFLFNLRYITGDQRTYSFSSSSSLGDLALYCAAVGGIAFLSGWSLWAWKTRLFQSLSPIEVMHRSLDFTWIVVGFWAVPVLVSFITNGVVSTWTLPDLAVLFPGLLGLIHMALVSITGMLLGGASALVVLVRRIRPAGELELVSLPARSSVETK